MKNLNYIPFNRNRYFYGKLLTAEDFLQEQSYMNDKRRLINRWMLGAGVVAGLEVIRVDDYHISLEMGLALDETGREILVESPVIKKLSTLDGFEEATQNTGDETLYLCIEYEESEHEPVQTIAQSGVHTTQEQKYNKAKEEYHLYVTDDEPQITESFDGCENEVRYIQDRASKVMHDVYQQAVYLAKVYLVKADSFYMIDRIEPVPFQQFAYSNRMIMGEVRRLQNRLLMKDTSKSGEEISRQQGELPTSASPWQFAEGTWETVLSKRKKEGDIEISPWMPHSLGLGDVQIFLRVLQEDEIYSGAEGIFAESGQTVVMASKVSQKEGTFQIGVRFLEDMDENSRLVIHWTAMRNREHNDIMEKEPRIYIKPSMARIKPRESCEFEAVCANMEDTGVVWSVKPEGGGTIDENGRYIAPSRPGVYEIIVQSRAYLGISSVVFVIVRE